MVGADESVIGPLATERGRSMDDAALLAQLRDLPLERLIDDRSAAVPAVLDPTLTFLGPATPARR
jgi:hypothetical protein